MGVYLSSTHTHTHTSILWPFFRDNPGEPVPEENFWTLWCMGRLTEADTSTIRLGATPSGWGTVVDEGQPSAGKSVKDRGAVVLVWSSSAPDTCYVSSDRCHRRAASLISPQPRRVHRLGRRHAVAHNCHCDAIVLLSSSTTAQCATMFATTSPADTRQSCNCGQSRLLLRSTGRCLQSPPESTSVRPQCRCPTRLLGEAIQTRHAATPIA